MSVAVTTQSTGYCTGNSNNAWGITTIIWGTDGLLVTPAPSSGSFAGTGFYIVESVDQETDSETIYIENGTGQKASRIIINNGQRWTLSAQDDTSFTPPKVGSTVVIKDGAVLIAGTAGTAYHTYTATVVNSGERFTRKGAAMRNITVESLALIDNQTPVA